MVADLCYVMLELGGLNSGKLGVGIEIRIGRCGTHLFADQRHSLVRVFVGVRLWKRLIYIVL